MPLVLSRANAAKNAPGCAESTVRISTGPALDFGAHPLERLRDGDDLAPGGVQRRGVHGLALAEEQQQAFLRQVGRDVAVDATVPVTLAEGEEVVDVDEREPGAMNQPVHLRER